MPILFLKENQPDLLYLFLRINIFHVLFAQLKLLDKRLLCSTMELLHVQESLEKKCHRSPECRFFHSALLQQNQFSFYMPKSGNFSPAFLGSLTPATTLFTKKYYNWMGTTDLGAYFVSTCSSHYEWAIKKIKAHCKKTR